MWGKHNLPTKNTFIDINTCVLGDSGKDPRKIQSWGAGSTLAHPMYINIDDVNTEDDTNSENESCSEFDDDWDSGDINRLKTFDPMEVLQSKPSLATADEGAPGNAMNGEEEKVRNQGPHNNLGAAARQYPCHAMGVPMIVSPSGPVPPPMFWSWTPAPDHPIVLTEQARGGMSSVRSQTKSVQGNGSNKALGKFPAHGTWTCRMLRNIPNDYSRQDLLELLDTIQLQYDFVYLPFDWGKRANLGYAFVNLVSNQEAERIAENLGGFSDWKVPSEKVCEVVWGTEDRQSLRKIIELFRNSPVMHPDVPEEFKPLLFRSSQRLVFPAPTKRIRPPAVAHKKSVSNQIS